MSLSTFTPDQTDARYLREAWAGVLCGADTATGELCCKVRAESKRRIATSKNLSKSPEQFDTTEETALEAETREHIATPLFGVSEYRPCSKETDFFLQSRPGSESICGEQNEKIVDLSAPDEKSTRDEAYSVRGMLFKAEEEVRQLKKRLQILQGDASRSLSPDNHISADITTNTTIENARNALHRAFPPIVADAVLHGHNVQPVSKDCVSVVFTDIVGFTALSSTMDAGKVASLLSRLFDVLDSLAVEHGVQKVDMIGDAYLAAANLLEDQAEDHVARAASFAVAAVAAARAIPIDADEAGGARVQLRAGVHCGPAAAALLGSWGGLKFTLVGDTVNVASRMESTSAAGRVQCSEAVARLVRRQAPGLGLEARAGGVDVKGKGLMQTYWIEHPGPTGS